MPHPARHARFQATSTRVRSRRRPHPAVLQDRQSGRYGWPLNNAEMAGAYRVPRRPIAQWGLWVCGQRDGSRTSPRSPLGADSAMLFSAAAAEGYVSFASA
jgi:hypothetical protein